MSLIKITVMNNAEGQLSSDLLQSADLAVAILIIMCFQSFLTMNLHCANLLVNMSRDEDI